MNVEFIALRTASLTFNAPGLCSPLPLLHPFGPPYVTIVRYLVIFSSLYIETPYRDFHARFFLATKSIATVLDAFVPYEFSIDI